jgi:3-phosphoshikimate 1-carboxyvinyltransferase
MKKQIDPGIRKGKIAIPASKSDGQRAYLAAALAKGTSRITGWGESKDEQAMRKAINDLGARVIVSPDGELEITGWEEFPAKRRISAGESGLGIRLLSFVCAAYNGTITIDGQGSLVNRPMTVIEEQLPHFEAVCRSKNGFVPLEIQGPMQGATVSVDGSLSSQFISGLLMALPLANGDSTLNVSDLKSGPYVEMTLQTLKAFGIRIDHRNLAHFSIPGNQVYQPTYYQVDADWSSAGYWLIASALGHNLEIAGLRNDSLQADKALLGFLEAANCEVVNSNGVIRVNGNHRRSFEVDATNCPDLFPALVTLAAYCNGKSVIRGAGRLVHKESHRGLTLQSEFGKLGVQIDLEDDRMIIHGTGNVNGGEVQSHHDHRIAMCLAIAGLNACSPVIVHDAEAVSKSYPGFWDDLEQLAVIAV